MATTSPLSPQQAHALFDILTHHQTYAEIQRYRYPDAIENYGPPFAIDTDKTSDSPILQTLLYRFVLTLPGLKDISPDFWEKRIEDLVRRFGEAELSESYDKGTIGSRKTLATAIATLIEYPARGVLGGIPKREIEKGENEYDLDDPEDVRQGWDDFLQELVYGDLIAHLEEKIGETDRLEEQTMRVQAAHEYILVNLASFLHYILILSPDGPYLVRTLENVHKLIPYTMMRSTLRVGNAATMINGMVKLLLTKVTINSVTSFLGLTNYSDAGMNMLQQIASTVIGWDITELKKQTATAEKAKDAPPKEHLEAIKNHMKDSRDERDKRRTLSEKSNRSIVQAIFDDRDVASKQLSEAQHAKSMDFFSIQLSIRDRQQLSNILCSLQPDIVTQAIRDMVAAYDPIIRQCHNAIDLSGTLLDFENFLTDLIKVSKGCGMDAPAATAAGISRPSTPRLMSSRPGTPKPASTPGRKSAEENRRATPGVQDYIKLLRKHQSASHRFLHQAVKNDKALADKWVTYAQDAVAQFRQHSKDAAEGGAGDMTPYLQKIFSELPEEQRRSVIDTLDEYTAYSMALSSTSQDKWTSFSSSGARGEGASAGPGMYLAKWQYLLDSTKITPATAKGPVRTGKDKSVREKVGVGVETAGTGNAVMERRTDGPEPPDVGKVVELLSKGFEDEIRRRGKEVWEKGS